ncbi:MAG: hypothetical protein K0S01_3850 [Herbinix sp.]|jgi:outer membrane lipoprotein-sorting protein|nr:hypothetical protein [Herbinix sp.]
MYKEKKLSRYIDELNAEKKPRQKGDTSNEYQKLTETVRLIRTVKETEYPDANYPERLIASLKGREPNKQQGSIVKIIKRAVILTAAAAAAAVLLFVSFDLALPNKNSGVVYAMEQAMKEVKAYHGVLNVIETNELGETMTQSAREVWADKKGNYYLTELKGTASGIITVNNGQEKWQIRPEEEVVYRFTTFPDPYRFTFELGNEIEEVRNAVSVKVVGDERIAGREASILEVTPEGGDTYRLWVDKETDLPLQRQSAMQNAIQYKVTFSSIEFEDGIPSELLVYNIPSGYEEIDTNPEQVISTIEEVESIVGFQPLIPEDIPEGYTLKKMAIQKNESAVKFYYVTKDQNKTVIILQSKVRKEFSTESDAILGFVNNNKAEIRTNSDAFSIRWQEQGMEYNVLGNISLEKLSAFAESLTGGKVIITDEKDTDKPQVEVRVDLAAEENDQKSVDAGHSPWKLDPVFVSQVFASLLLSPEGIIGDYPIAYEDIQMVKNNGTDAIAEIKSDTSIAKRVYLKRLIRQDDTGIWSVVGYDPAE